MAITNENIIKKIDVIPDLNGLTNVIKRVVIEIVLKDLDLNPNVESKALVASVLDTSNIDSFVPIDSLTDEQIIEWTYAPHGGEENFINMIKQHHGEVLQRKHDCYGVQEYDRELQAIVEGTGEYDSFLG